MACSRENGCGEQMQRELILLRNAGILVFPVALSSRVDEQIVRAISSVPQLINRNYFLSPSISNLNRLSDPLSTQVTFPTRCAFHVN